MQDVNPTRENEFHRMQLRLRGDVDVEDTRLGFDMSAKKKWRVDEAFKG